jgi:cytochrome c553
MTAKLVATLSLVVALGWTVSAVGAGSREAGQAKSVTCAACHGADGTSLNPEWPNLAGQHPAFIANQVTAFRGGQRENMLMTPMAAALTDEDIADLAAFFSAQPVRGGETDPSKLKLGQRVYRTGKPDFQVMACAGCHGPAGRGNLPAAFPSIQGQHATYVAAQLRAYRSGTRTTDRNQMMRNIAATLTDEEIDAVASFVQGLR